MVVVQALLAGGTVVLVGNLAKDKGWATQLAIVSGALYVAFKANPVVEQLVEGDVKGAVGDAVGDSSTWLGWAWHAVAG